ncbi:hypothetical protein GCM10009839_58970 [Catenulispora yoronensis]|uniref:Holin n=1 Tax=Catenulispora yoronensis TaxID=450799 RepID=A0ABN2V0P7_9ACTN
MQSFRRIKDALKRALKGRKRLATAVITAAVGFVTGALLPEASVLTGAAVATVALVFLQVSFAITDGRNNGASPASNSESQTPPIVVDQVDKPELPTDSAA